MEIASLDSPIEVEKISEYLQYINLSDEPVFASLIEEGAKLLSNWGAESPPGGPGDCLVQKGGKFFNGSCQAKNNFICEDPKEDV
ncbi:Hypothetical predicted protein [Cloeon dipterum]|uniref:C-type lectin domain-containing protein n=1 Tax=Cloeon dipterum TaxID=197152 RepID=A0A8S1DYP7_9INSE|nr:Hypothetical predicted protein [Cloeon dipterum]